MRSALEGIFWRSLALFSKFFYFSGKYRNISSTSNFLRKVSTYSKHQMPPNQIGQIPDQCLIQKVVTNIFQTERDEGAPLTLQ